MKKTFASQKIRFFFLALALFIISSINIVKYARGELIGNGNAIQTLDTVVENGMSSSPQSLCDLDMKVLNLSGTPEFTIPNKETDGCHTAIEPLFYSVDVALETSSSGSVIEVESALSPPYIQTYTGVIVSGLLVDSNLLLMTTVL